MCRMVSEVLISIIVPIYNAEEYLEQCIQSIVGQTFHNLDIVLVDDGSSDSCGVIGDRWAVQDKRIQVVHKQNQGLGPARNTGLDHAKGQYVIFVDSDDFLASNAVERLYESIQREGCDTIFCGWSKYIEEHTIIRNEQYFGGQKFSNNGQVIEKVLLEIVGTNPTERVDSNFSMSVCHALYSIDIIREHNICFPSERDLISEDLFFNIDYLKRSESVFVISDCLYYYRYTTNSLTTKFNPERFDKEVFMYNRLKQNLGEFLPEEKYILRLQRMFLGRVRSCIMRCMLSSDQSERIRGICSDRTVTSVLKTYPYWKNPLRHKIFNLFVRYQIVWGIKLLAKLGNRMH